jgi:transketolase
VTGAAGAEPRQRFAQISLEPSRAAQDTPIAMLDRPTIESLRKRSFDLRIDNLTAIAAAGNGHPGGTLSVMDILQQGLEDIALMRALPTMAVIQPGDDLETDGAVEYLMTHKGPAFLRTTRQKLDRINKEGFKFQFGKGTTKKFLG